MPAFSPWDYALLIVVSGMSLAMAKIHHPKWKALMLALPIPFSLAFLAVGRRADATNMSGVFLLLIFTHGVRLLHVRFGRNIILSIAASALIYCGIGTLLAGRLSTGDMPFLLSSLFVFGVALALIIRLPRHDEPGGRTPLPVWAKLPIIMGIVFVLIVIKQWLRGFMTVFPMVGILGAYEARFCLWTVCRQIPVVMLCFIPMLTILRYMEPILGTAGALVLGWGAYLVVLLFTNRMAGLSAPKIRLPGFSGKQGLDF